MYGAFTTSILAAQSVYAHMHNGSYTLTDMHMHELRSNQHAPTKWKDKHTQIWANNETNYLLFGLLQWIIEKI